MSSSIRTQSPRLFHLLDSPDAPEQPTARFPWTIEVSGRLASAYVKWELGSTSRWVSPRLPLTVGPFRLKTQAISATLRVVGAAPPDTSGAVTLQKLGQEPILLWG